MSRLLRLTLGLSVPFNLFAATVLAFPGSAPGQAVGLPATVPIVYAALSSYLVALFGVVYGWMATQKEVNRPLLAVAAIGKAGVFLVALALWQLAGLPGTLVLLASGDAVFAALWFGWLLGERPATE